MHMFETLFIMVLQIWYIIYCLHVTIAKYTKHVKCLLHFIHFHLFYAYGCFVTYYAEPHALISGPVSGNEL